MYYLRILALFAVCCFVLSACGDELNTAPVADAGEDQVVETESTVQLDGSGSLDEDEDEEIELTYAWQFESLPTGSSAALSNTNTVDPSFTADVSGTYDISLVVSDGTKESDEDLVQVVATYKPVAVISVGNTDVTVGDTVQLDGSQSTDEDGDDLTYEWSIVERPSESDAELSDSASETPTLTTDAADDYEISLVVSDGHLESDEDSVTITATE
jgi:hypothetical protein